MRDSTESHRRVRLFLDSGVILQGCQVPWGAAKAVLILATLRERYMVVFAEAVEREVQRAIVKKTVGLGPSTRTVVAQSVAGWIGRVRLERWPYPSESALKAHLPTVLPALRHLNDLPAVVTAIQSNPDWVISTSDEHWNRELAQRTNLRIVTPLDFLLHLRAPDRARA